MSDLRVALRGLAETPGALLADVRHSACWRPASHATWVDSTIALRHEYRPPISWRRLFSLPRPDSSGRPPHEDTESWTRL